MGQWKGIRLGRGSKLQLYDLQADLGEENDVADEHPDIVRQLERIMDTAATPSERCPIGTLYQGHPIWQKTW
jgi:hypothetical protein